jgi:hypothetical protein
MPRTIRSALSKAKRPFKCSTSSKSSPLLTQSLILTGHRRPFKLNPMRSILFCLLAFALLPTPTRAQAPVFETVPAASSVKFYVKASVALTGKFDEWHASLKFKSPDVTTGVLDIKIAAASVNTGSGMKNDKLKSKDFPLNQSHRDWPRELRRRRQFLHPRSLKTRNPQADSHRQRNRHRHHQRHHGLRPQRLRHDQRHPLHQNRRPRRSNCRPTRKTTQRPTHRLPAIVSHTAALLLSASILLITVTPLPRSR